MSDMENKMSDLIDSGIHEQESLYKQIEQLKADRLELAKAIKADHLAGFYGDECVFCYGGENVGHDKDCIVLKAEKIIEEIEK